MNTATAPQPNTSTGNVSDSAYFGLDIPFMEYLGLQAEHMEDGYVRTRLPAHPMLVNSRGDTHGGTLMSVLDFTLSAAARSHDPHNLGVVTVEMSTHFLDVARGELVFEARNLRRGRSTVFSEGTVTNAAGDTVCVARATFKLIKRNKP
ncbi:hotdog fold thioesterase [Pusillimonas sp. TS35]|nr:hotdog fold thioesterase [Pusillimonas sp. TS35]